MYYLGTLNLDKFQLHWCRPYIASYSNLEMTFSDVFWYNYF